MYRCVIGDLIIKKGKRITINGKVLVVKSINKREFNLFEKIINFYND